MKFFSMEVRTLKFYHIKSTQEHLLKFTAHHRAETASKRGNVSTCGEG